VPDTHPSTIAAVSIKLQTYLAHAGIASRRQCEELIGRDEITVNGEPAYIGQRVIPGKDLVRYRHQVVTLSEPPIYILIDKPVGIVSTTSDELQRPTILSVLPPELRRYRLYPVGRLDQDSTGLVLLTNDGDLAYRLTHPKFKVNKTYLVKLDRIPTEPALDNLKRGVKLKEGKTARAKVALADDTLYQELIDADLDLWYTITIHEGRNRQVRRMWERVGYEVQKLIRVSMGPLTLEQLAGAEYLVLSELQIKNLKQSFSL